MKEEIIDLIVTKEYSDIRIDKFIMLENVDLSRSYIQKLIKEEAVLVNAKPVKTSYKVVEGESITITVPEPEELGIQAENIPLDIIYEDQDFIIINKQKGMVVHPAPGHYTGTIVNAVMYHCKGELSAINGILRPGIVHRIDMNTTGALVVCKNDKAHTFIAEQLKEHSITRKYNAIVYNSFKDECGSVDAPIGRNTKDRKKMSINSRNGKRAVTHYKVLENFNTKYAHIECTLETGRTHQIRVHMTSIHHPLLGDDIYGPAQNTNNLEGQTLHASILGFIHPTTREYVEFEAPLPDYFTDLISKLRK